MKRSLKMMVALFALFIATTGFSNTTQTEQSEATQTTAASADAGRMAGYDSRNMGYLSIHIREGVAHVIINESRTGTTHHLVVNFLERQLEEGSTYEIHAAEGFRIRGNFTGQLFGTIIAGERSEVEVSLEEVYP